MATALRGSGQSTNAWPGRPQFQQRLMYSSMTALAPLPSRACDGAGNGSSKAGGSRA
jgi:hypothetical protein